MLCFCQKQTKLTLAFDKHLKEYRRDIAQYDSANALHIQEALTAPAKLETISAHRKF